jgi:isoamylase
MLEHIWNNTLFDHDMQDMTNFAIFSASATGVSLCLFTEKDLENGRLSHQIPLDPELNRTGDIWHIAIPQLDSTLLYGYMVNGPNQKDNPRYPGHSFDNVSYHESLK